MKIHITGMAPRMVSDRARAKVSFSSLLADMLRVCRHEVARDADLHDDADLVVVGLSSMLSPGSTYSIVALGALGRAVEQGTPVLLYVDDPNMGKVRDAAASVRRDPDRLWSDFLTAKRVMKSDLYDRSSVMLAVDLLGGEEWPITLVPMHAWGRASTLPKELRVISEIVPIDMTPFFNAQLAKVHWESKQRDAEMWLCEQNYTACGLSDGRTQWPVLRSKNSPSWNVREVYGQVRAVFQDTITPCLGWWTPTPLFAAAAGSVYLTGIEDSALIGDPYYLTVEQIEALTVAEQQQLAQTQRHHIKGVSWNLITLISVLEDVLGRSTSWPTPGTTTLAAM